LSSHVFWSLEKPLERVGLFLRGRLASPQRELCVCQRSQHHGSPPGREGCAQRWSDARTSSSLKGTKNASRPMHTPLKTRAEVRKNLPVRDGENQRRRRNLTLY